MKKFFTFLMLLGAVSCSQPKPKSNFQDPATLTAEAPVPQHGGLIVTAGTNATLQPVITEPPAQPEKPRDIPAAMMPAAPAITVSTLPTNTPAAPEEMIPAGTINFPAADLKEVLKIYSELVNRTILQPANLGSPQITLKTQTPLTKKEALEAFEAVFALNGISLVNVGDKFVKVVPAAQANMEGGPNDTRPASELPDIGQYITHVAHLNYVKPSEIIPALQPFAKLNSLLPLDGSGILIIRDYTENVKRMLEMIDQIDVHVPSDFISEVIPIKYAKASEMADALNSLGAGGSSGSVGGGSSSSRGTARAGALANGQNRAGGGFGSGASGGALAGGAGYGSGLNTPGAANPGAPTSFTDRLSKLISKASSSGDIQLFGQMKMIADERSNSLLIFATRGDMEIIKGIIAKLDVVLAQVLIETLILDVQIGHGWNYGVNIGQTARQVGGGTNSPVLAGGVLNNSDNSLGTLANFFSGVASGSNAAGIFPSAGGLQYFGRYTGGLDVAVQAAASDSRVNVVQRPQILTTHATPGSIFVGSTVPYVTGSSYGGAYGAGNTYQQLQVGIGLQVTPYINQDGLVVMQIDETIDEISGSIAIANVGNVPTTTSRKLSAEVAVKDGETIILGGFIRNSDDKEKSGVPLLRDIPILGKLFESQSDTKARNELLVMMKPTVLRTPEIAAQHTIEMKKTMPGTVRAEKEVHDDEQNALKAEEQREKLERLREQKANAKNKSLSDLNGP